MQSKPNFFQQPVNNKWGIRSKLKSGGFGSVYLARDLKDEKKQYAIKLIPQEGRRYAEIEEKMYALIEKQQFTNGFIKYYQTGDFMKHRYLVMELIGRDLDELKKKSKHQSFSIKSVLMVGLQLIDRLEALHKIGYLHRDVKPENIASGLSQKNKIIYLFDFGLALPINSQIPKEEKGRVVGTLGFMSCRAHEGKQQGPVDDIESMFYTLLYLAEGTLPWLKLKVQSPADFHKILLMKRGLTKKIFKNLSIPSELFELLNLIQSLKFNDKVDYLKIKYKLLEGLKRIDQKNDFIFDWCSNSSRRQSPSNEKRKGNYTPEDTQRKNQHRELMNQQNQQLIQNDVYQVYKFIEGAEKKNPNKKQVLKKKSPKKEQKQQQKRIQKVRPSSAAVKKPKQQQKIPKPWEKILLYEESNMVSGPKIVINKTAKHKI